MTGKLHIKRVYEAPASTDGLRILVDRLWPRGLTKEKAALDHWLKEIAPSDALRHWFGHDPEKWVEFQQRYYAELRAKPDAVKELHDMIGTKTATLLYAAHDSAHNNAVALRDFLVAHD